MNLAFLEMRGEIAVITLNRPEKRNALNIPLLKEFSAAIEAAGQNSKVRVVLIRGEGPVFCAGLDLKELLDPSLSEASSELIAQLLSSLHRCSKVTIAAVQGTAVAGGMGIIAACDFVIAADNCKFALSETRRGLVAAQIMVLLARQLKSRDLSDLALSGRTINAAEAKAMGLITRTVPEKELLPEAEATAKEILKGAPEATVLTKEFIEAIYPSSFEEDLSKALKCHKKMRNTSEAKEGVSSFLEKRAPVWEAAK